MKNLKRIINLNALRGNNTGARKMNETKKPYTIQLKPSINNKAKVLAEELNISKQELFERLVLNAIGETK